MGGGPIDIGKEIISLASTAGIKKDIIDLLKEKVTLLTEKIAALEADNSELKQKVTDLEKDLEHLRPPQEGFEEGAIQILKAMFSAGGNAFFETLAPQLRMSKSMADYHADSLLKSGMIEP